MTAAEAAAKRKMALLNKEQLDDFLAKVEAFVTSGDSVKTLDYYGMLDPAVFTYIQTDLGYHIERREGMLVSWYEVTFE